MVRLEGLEPPTARSEVTRCLHLATGQNFRNQPGQILRNWHLLDLTETTLLERCDIAAHRQVVAELAWLAGDPRRVRCYGPAPARCTTPAMSDEVS